jgi:hypothetical protein
MYLKVAQDVDIFAFFCRYASYENSANPGSTSCNRGCLIVQCTILFPTVRMEELRQCIYMYGQFLLHHRQSIVSSHIKAEAKGEFHFIHTGSKGFEYAFPTTKTPST